MRIFNPRQVRRAVANLEGAERRGNTDHNAAGRRTNHDSRIERRDGPEEARQRSGRRHGQ